MFRTGDRHSDEERGQEGEFGISSPFSFFDCHVIKNCPKR